VYTARQSAIRRTVVLKLSNGKVGSQNHAALHRQAEALAGLDHPNLLRLYDYGEDHGQPYMVLEYVTGGVSLSHRLRESAVDTDLDGKVAIETVGRPLTPRAAAETARLIALAIQAVHDRGYPHCGLNPGDVILTPTDIP